MVERPVRMISIGGHFACALGEGGDVQCWGANDVGQTGTSTGSAECRLGGAPIPCNPIPVKVAGLPGPATTVATGYSYALALMGDGSVWGWGASDGLLGRAGPEPRQLPLPRMATIGSNQYHACGC